MKNSDVAKKYNNKIQSQKKKKREKKALAINAVVFGLLQRLDFKKKNHKYIVRCSMPE